jgi:hypothetical protein
MLSKNTLNSLVAGLAGSSAVKELDHALDSIAGYAVGPGLPYPTIQSALNAIGPAKSNIDAKRARTVFITAGTYDEDLVLPRGRIINIVCLGSVVLGNNLGSNFGSTNARSITAVYDNADVFSDPNVKPGLTITPLFVGDATSSLVAEASCMFISGNINISGNGVTHNVYLAGVKLAGNLTSSSLGATNLFSYRTLFGGTITGVSILIYRAVESEFTGLISVNGYSSFVGCEIKAGMTVTANQNLLPPSGMFHTTCFGTFTTPAGGVKLDASSNYFFKTNGCVLGGSATKVILGDLAP